MPLQVPRPNTLPLAHPTSCAGSRSEAAGSALCRDTGLGLARASSGAPCRQQGLGFSRGLTGAASVASCEQQSLDKGLPWPCQDEGGRAAVGRHSGACPAPDRLCLSPLAAPRPWSRGAATPGDPCGERAGAGHRLTRSGPVPGSQAAASSCTKRPRGNG